MMQVSPQVLARLQRVPGRLGTAFLTFGSMLGIPAFCTLIAAVCFIANLEVVGGIAMLLALLSFVGCVIVIWVLIFQARARIGRAERALDAGDFDLATREARFVVRTVFRSDYQTAALATLALAAERLGAFADAGNLYSRAFDMVPAMAAHKPGRRARALLAAHAAIDFAAAGQPAPAHAMLARCHAALGVGQAGAFDALLDDSYMGAVGINTLLVELEARRAPRPLGVLAGILIAFKDGQAPMAMQLITNERATLDQGLLPHERALVARIESESLRLAAGAGPHRSPSELAPTTQAMHPWASLVLPPPQVT